MDPAYCTVYNTFTLLKSLTGLVIVNPVVGGHDESHHGQAGGVGHQHVPDDNQENDLIMYKLYITS